MQLWLKRITDKFQLIFPHLASISSEILIGLGFGVITISLRKVMQLQIV